MPARPDMSLVIRMGGLLLRADIHGDTDPKVTLWRQDWPDMVSALADIFGKNSKSGKPGKRVWLLDTEVWLGSVDLPAGAVAGQSDKDLAGPAAYEVEAISDLSPAQAVTAVQRRRLADRGDQFLVTQARRSDVLAIAKGVRQARAKLVGLGHPCGLPAALSFDSSVQNFALRDAITRGEQQGDWRRVEFWSGAVVLVEYVSGSLRLIPLGVGPQSDWRRSLASFLRDAQPVAEDQTLVSPGVRVRGGTHWRENTAIAGTARWLAAGEAHEDEDDGVASWDLANNQTAERFAQDWALKLKAMKPNSSEMAPMLKPPKAPASPVPSVLVGILALGLAVFAVISLREQATDRLVLLEAQFKQVQQEQKGLKSRSEQVNKSKAELRRKKAVVDDLEAQLAQLRSKLASTNQAQDHVDQRAALAAMMVSLSDSSSRSFVIEKIEYDSMGHWILGIAISPEGATRLAHTLSEQLDSLWVVTPAQIEPEMLAGQLVWRFRIMIEPAVNMELHRELHR